MRTPSVSPDILEKYLRAGRIAREARDFGATHATAGKSCLELANAIEILIRERGGQCAFPVNIGINEIAAHYTPSRNNDMRLKEGDIVKLDVGAHVEGYPADTSITVEVGTRKHSQLIRCAEDALGVCIEMVAPGTTMSAIGSAVERVIKSAGYRPVQNLTGHSMERYNLHAGLSIPSIETKDKTAIEEGMVIAIEPFSTTGSGKVDGKGRGSIFRIIRERRAPADVEQLFVKMKQRFGPFPFAGRWCEELDHDAEALLQKMVRLGMIMSYPVLTEIAGGVVAQAEHSVVVTSNGCRILT